MSDVPPKSYFFGISLRTGFKTDSLEKVYRILSILDRIGNIPLLSRCLALKGGTALHGLVFGFRRLSVDIDMNYIGNIKREIMQKDREDIKRTLSFLFTDMGYNVDKPVSMYAQDQFNLHYTNCGGGADRVKLEINYLERLPVLGTIQGQLHHPFTERDVVDVLSYHPEELFAGKIRALIIRGTPRDIYDSDLIARRIHPFDGDLLRKMVLFYLSMSAVDVRTLSLDSIDKVTDKNIRDTLQPMLSRSDVPDLGSMKMNIRENIGPFLELTGNETLFFDTFYEDKRMEQGLLFEDIEVTKDLSSHPGILWRWIQLDNKEKGEFD